MAKKENRHAELVSASANIEAPYELPEGWKWEKWGNIGNFISGNGFKEKFQGFTDYDIPFYKVGSLKYSDSSGFLFDRTNTINNEILRELKASLIPENSIIFAKIGEAIRLNRRSINSEKCCIDNNLMAFLPQKCDYKYAFYWSKNIDLYNYTNATTVPAIRKSDLEEIPFPLPPTLEEQQRIVNRIESMFAKLDEAKEKAQNVVDCFETRKAAILHKAFSGELTANWRKKNGVSDDSWEEKRLEDVCDFITKGTTPKKEDMSIGIGDIPYIKVYNLCFDTKLDFTIDPTFVKLESHKNFLARSITLPGDVLMNIVGPPFGKVSIVPDTYPEWNINQAIARFRCKPELYNVYLANYLISPKTIENMSRQIKTTAGQQNLTLEICRNITIPVPTFTEQQEIVRILDTILKKESRAKEAAQTVLDQIALLKKSILARAFRGEL